jgi:hypothetical protein
MEITFKLFMEDQEKPVVAFDFDGVLHKSLWPGTTHPTNFVRWKEWEPNERMHEQLRQEAQHNTIVVVSRRHGVHQAPMWKFIKKYKLPVDQIYTTDDGPKRNVLMQLGAIRHYDDDPSLAHELDGTGIEFIHVNPRE